MKLEARVTPVNIEGSNIAGLGTVTVNGEVYLNNIRVMMGQEGNFVAMPSRKTDRVDTETGKPVYQEFFNPITKECREALNEVVMAAFNSPDGKAETTMDGVTDELNFRNARGGVHVYKNPNNNVLGIGSVTLNGQIALNTITVVDGENGKFASFPSYKTTKIGEDGNPEYQNYFNMKKDVHAKLSEVLVSGYEKALAKQAEKQQGKSM